MSNQPLADAAASLRRACLFASLLIVSSCAPRVAVAPPRPEPPTAGIDALVRQGCYRCLESAFAAASAAGLGDKSYEVAVLLAARSKELGLDWAPWMVKAHQALPPGPEWPVYVDVVEGLADDPLSGDRDVLLSEEFARRRPRDIYDRWRAALATGPGSPVVRAYLDLAIACRRQQVEGREEAIAAVLGRFGDVPLLQYRVALCGDEQAPARLAAVRGADAAFVDADLELGRMMLQNQLQPNVDQGLRHLESARAAFPQSPVMPSLIADVYQAREQWPEALAMYDGVIALVPTHRDALLGRTISLSHLSRYEEAATSATRLIDLGNWFLGPAHYWRAWNEFQLKRITEARADADLAKTLMVNPSTFVLSGLIEWVEKRLDSAEGEFQRALDMDFGQCDAAFYLGGVRAEQRNYPESLAAYQHAHQCFGLSITVRREAIARLSATEASAAANAREIASHQRGIADAQKRLDEATTSISAIERFLHI